MLFLDIPLTEVSFPAGRITVETVVTFLMAVVVLYNRWRNEQIAKAASVAVNNANKAATEARDAVYDARELNSAGLKKLDVIHILVNNHDLLLKKNVAELSSKVASLTNNPIDVELARNALKSYMDQLSKQEEVNNDPMLSQAALPIIIPTVPAKPVQVQIVGPLPTQDTPP